MSEEERPYRPLGSARPLVEPGGALPLATKRLALVTGGHRRLGGIIAGAWPRPVIRSPSMAVMTRGSIPIWR